MPKSGYYKSTYEHTRCRASLFIGREGGPTAWSPRQSVLMSQDAFTSEKSAHVGLRAHEDARELVRLVQCTQCSKPFRNPVTLPCGNSICRDCLPQPHVRENISYPDLPGRRQGVLCPFGGCGNEHPTSDCSVDVVLTKTMEGLAEVIAKHTSLINDDTIRVEEVRRWDEAVDGSEISEKPQSYDLSGGRLVATYTLAAQGKLDRKTDLNFPDLGVGNEQVQSSDTIVLQDILESTGKEVDCQVCYNVLLDPVTTYCGHTLCRKCMARVLDHSLYCPVCRRPLAIPPSLSRHPSNNTITNLLNGLCPDVIATRAEAVAAEDTAGQGEMTIPLFVCTLGFPHQPTLLRIFEPRYRLMLRRCMESNREFGMLMYNRYGEPQGELGPVHFYHYGTMLYVIHTQLLPDGTSLVETRGSYRFRVKAHGVQDGYCVGNVERVEDVSLAEEEQLEAEETGMPAAEEGDVMAQIQRMSTADLLALGQEFVQRMRSRSAGWLAQRVLDVHGQPPEDPSVFPYWFASVLPISDEEKYKLMSTRTVRERLKITAIWIRRIEAQRWYQSSSCRIL